ncbi:Uncharacterised protein [Salmonella enterica subsp. houtenae serovar Houten]|nr:Uncharacterised protein [Salmonella enterica subsp. houtenae serovar Houten]SUF53366.1 Uncharacterised protein [Salmonella enterica]
MTLMISPGIINVIVSIKNQILSNWNSLRPLSDASVFLSVPIALDVNKK